MYGADTVSHQRIACTNIKRCFMSPTFNCNSSMLYNCRGFRWHNICMSKSEQHWDMSITSKSVSVPTTTTGFLSVCAKVGAVGMSVCAIWWSHAPRGTLANCCQIQASVRCLCHLHSAVLQRSIVCWVWWLWQVCVNQISWTTRPRHSIHIWWHSIRVRHETTTTQKYLLANSKNKARLIDNLTTELQRVGVLVKQGHMIMSLHRRRWR